ncbi:hypothetical protein A2841_00155 [Candidatus Kaiserbacteria bacterium RIFCSPHIGHO2_01_FULL_48_10]|uniref:Uncharacterized protein n=1 Tax=Candidatus Kaiserbacteria bacterium RIFCSPHIGHO2_01_FULL_48_10 TaxID=1798476 RepID=A0A1F6C5T4_9BACT|nr:MAG: hypothetical protein A2841_00155 [Candidatus Kaiserbacteria bacterium RIFCSPHIGHO2_01_FULL_48_10]
MYNWSTDEKILKKDKKKYAIWKLEQMVNFGLGGKKLDQKMLKKYWRTIKIDPQRRKFLILLLYGKRNFNEATNLSSSTHRKR